MAGSALVAAAQITGQSEPLSLTTALETVLAKQVGYCGDWLDGKDAKSLARTAGGGLILSDLLATRGDTAAWREATAEVTSAAKDLEASAKKAASGDPPDLKECQDSLDRLKVALMVVTVLEPHGKPQAVASKPPLRPLMYLQEAVLADAKIALAVGEPKTAKVNAEVLSELGRAVLNSRSDAQWTQWGQNLVSASRVVADSTSDDTQTLRPLLREVAQSCEACHKSR